jgi:hypothetical protein
MNIRKATALNPPAKKPVASSPSLAIPNPVAAAPMRRIGPRKTAAAAIPKETDRPCLVSSR